MQSRLALLCAVALLAATCQTRGGGSGLNLVVIVNQNSTNSLQLANSYCEQRAVPPQNVLRLTNQWSGGSISCNTSEFENNLLGPLLDMIRRRNLTNQIQFVLLSMDLPYQVIGSNGINSTTSALFYGFKPDTNPPVEGIFSCTLPTYSSNSYAFSEREFSTARPGTAPTNSFLALMLTDTTLAGAQLILGRGVASDGSHPIQAVYLAKTTDPARNVRFLEFDDALFNTRLMGGYNMVRTNTDATSFTNLLGLQTGLANLSLATNAFVPGATGDSLTSYAGLLFQSSGQTPLLAFLEAGAAGSYGTVVEPCNYLEKFPSPLNFFYQSRGFSLAEAYYQSLRNPYQGLIVGEPLAAPFARHAQANWTQLPTNTCTLTGQTNLQPSFTSSFTNNPLSKIDLFIDGNWFKTVTNMEPSAGDALSLNLNGTLITYNLPTNTTLISATLGLAAGINSVSNVTKVAATAVGDRIELHLLDPTMAGANATLSITNATINTNRTTLLTASQNRFLDSLATGFRYVFVTNPPALGDWLQLTVTKTNGSIISLAVTNNNPLTTIGQLVLNLVNLVNATSSLQSSDGLVIADYLDYDAYGLAAAEFFIYARSGGWPAARMQVALSASPGLLIATSPGKFLDDNLADLQPRNHLYISSGALALPVSLNLDTTQFPDGYHDLTFVAYEGTSVRTQTRITRNVRVQNFSLSATLNTLFGGPNSDLNSILQFSVAANTNTVSAIELFTTGGSIGIVSNQPSALFSMAGTNLGLGLHPFYAIVTGSDGKQFRTQTTWIRLLGPEPSFAISAAASPIRLMWPATAGRSYDLLSTTNLFGVFNVTAAMVPSNSAAAWIETNPSPQRFYRIRTSP